jgi:Tol biopolymer transport system component
MATVYLAHDLRNNRKVALKVLRPELAAILGAERFLKEIEVTANLQHPHILPLFDSGQADSFLFYVMPFVEGESLRDRLTREKQLPIQDAVRIATEVAGALDYAHRHGVIHRDVKPENILLHDGRALVADFGIALAMRKAGGARLTETGLSLGTPQYMSPEQATAERELDARTDIYALGAVTYEMLTGEPPFMGTTTQAIIAKLMTEAPRPLTVLRPTVPEAVERAVLIALQKLPADRFASAAEFAQALAHPDGATGRTTIGARAAATPSWHSWLRDRRTVAALALAGLAGVAAVAGLLRAGGAGDATGAPEVLALSAVISDTTLTVEIGYMAQQLDFAPDEQAIAFTATRSGRKTVMLRQMNSFELTEVPGGGELPRFSPDGRSLAYLRDGGLWVTPVERPAPVRIGQLPGAMWKVNDMLWHASGSLLIGDPAGIWALPAAGGTARLLAAADTTRSTDPYLSALPDGRVLVNRVAWRTPVTLSVIDPRTGATTILENQSLGVASRFVAGWLIGDQGGQLVAQRFDPVTLRVSGDPVVKELSGRTWNRDYRFSPRGALAMLGTVGATRMQLVWVDRTGRETPLPLPAGWYRHPRPSPSGYRVVVSNLTEHATTVFDLRTGARLNIRSGANEPTWTPDGKRVITASFVPQALVSGPAETGGTSDTISPPGHDWWPTSVSPDGRTLLAYSGDEQGDLFTLELATRTERRISLPGEQRGGRFAPDGRAIAYQSAESGRPEVFLQAWPSLAARTQLSTDGGTEPVWSVDGRELFFRQRDSVMAVPIGADGLTPTGPARLLFSGPYYHDVAGDQSWDVAPDGRFLLLRPVRGALPEVRIVKNWVATLEAGSKH